MIQEFITLGIAPEERAALGNPPVGHGLLGALTREPHPIRIPNIAADSRSVGFPPNHPPMTSLLGARIIGRGTVFGNIYLIDKQGAEMFDEEDERRVSLRRGDGSIVSRSTTTAMGSTSRPRPGGWVSATSGSGVESRAAGCSRSRAAWRRDDRPGDVPVLSQPIPDRDVRASIVGWPSRSVLRCGSCS